MQRVEPALLGPRRFFFDDHIAHMTHNTTSRPIAHIAHNTT